MNSALARMDGALEEVREACGIEPEVYRYRPDLYPTSYVFHLPDVKLDVTVLPDRVSKIDAFFVRPLNEQAVEVLVRLSGLFDWEALPLTDQDFAIQFPSFSPKSDRNFFFRSSSAFALFQRDVGGFAAVVQIQSRTYLQSLHDYRRTK